MNMSREIENITDERAEELLQEAEYGYYYDSTYIPMRKDTPSVLIASTKGLETGEIKNLPMITPVGKVRQAMTPEGEYYKKDGKGHGLDPSQIVSAIRNMDNPKRLFWEKEHERYAVLVSYDGSKGKQALIPIDTNKNTNPDRMNGYQGGAYNIAVSVFNQEKLSTYVANSNHVKIDIKIEDDPQRGSSGSALSLLNESSSKNNISQNSEEIKSEFADENTRFSVREEDPPKNTVTGYKVFRVKDGKLYPPMVANPGGADTPVGVWLNADVGERAPDSKTGRAQVKGKGGMSLSFRPGWHLGDIPRASQFDRMNPETGVKDMFPADFVWAECDCAADVDYQDEAMSYGYTDNGKFRHAYAGLPRVPENGYYKYRTNPRPDTVPWIITGAMKVNRILSDAEVAEILTKNGVTPPQRQGGNKTLEDLGLNNNHIKRQDRFDELFDDDYYEDMDDADLIRHHLVVDHAAIGEVLDRTRDIALHHPTIASLSSDAIPRR